MVKTMNQAETLCHSSGPWKKHKYFQKIGEGANAVYKYAKDKADKKIQGEAVSKNHLIQDNPAGNKLLADQDREAYEEMKRREKYIKDNAPSIYVQSNCKTNYPPTTTFLLCYLFT